MNVVRPSAITPEAVVVEIDIAGLLATVSLAQLQAEIDRRAAARGDAEALTGSHVRAARALLDWTRERLGREAGVSVDTVARLESSAPGQVRAASVAAVRLALAAGGAEFRIVGGALCLALRGAAVALDDAQVPA